MKKTRACRDEKLEGHYEGVGQFETDAIPLHSRKQPKKPSSKDIFTAKK